jgi:predicted signal transduction protein with EAL and GGDEF domain
VSARLRQVIGDVGFAARLGCDEFLVLAQVAEARQVAQVANQIVRRLGETYRVGSHELYLGASVGVTTYPFDNSEADVLISHADEAMYDIKHGGGNGVRFFVPGTSVFTMARLELERDLRHVVELGQLELHYQPQVDVGSGRIRGLEALARWRHPTHGWIAPVASWGSVPADAGVASRGVRGHQRGGESFGAAVPAAGSARDDAARRHG